MTLLNPVISKEEDSFVVLDITCPSCGKVNQLMASKAGIRSWRQGEHIQNAFPELNPDQRELLLTGICGKCWDDTFKEEDE